MHRTQSVSLGIISIVVVACSSPTPPTNDVAPTPDFIVATGINAVAVGNSTRFTVTAYTRDILGGEQTADVSASAFWFTDNPAVAAVNSKNIVGRTVGMTNVRASYRNREYSLPVYVVAPNPQAEQFSGAWSGVTSRSCFDLIGNTRSCLDSSGKPGVSITNVSMSLTNIGGVLQGSIDIGGGFFSHFIGSIVGGVNENGELVIGGAPTYSEHLVSQQLRDWRLSLSGARLIGGGASDTAFVNVYGPVWQRITYTGITLNDQH